MKQINLLPRAEQKDLHLRFFSEDLIRFWVNVVISILICTALIYVGKAYLTSKVSDIESIITVERQKLKTSDNESLKREVEELNSKLSAVKNINIQKYYWSQALVELGVLLSPDIKLDTMSLNRSTGQVTISGIAGSRESVLKFWADVHKSEYFKNINFPLANLNRAFDDPFSFTFYINVEKLKTP